MARSPKDRPINPQDVADLAAAVTAVGGLIGMVDSTAMVREAAKSYKTILLDDGWSAESAEAMAVEFHRHTLELMFRRVT